MDMTRYKDLPASMNRFTGYSELHYQRLEVAAGLEAFFNWAGVPVKPHPDFIMVATSSTYGRKGQATPRVKKKVSK